MLWLSDIFDQPVAIEQITRAWESDRLPHGLVFAGPTGVGKGTTATALAALFLCQKPSGACACGTCESCRLMASGNHPDFTLVYRQLIRLEKEESKAKDIAIDLVRDYITGPAGLKPMLGRGRVFVVEEAETMNGPAQNALLKTLEEPGGRTLLILLTDQPDSLLPTIRSRCQTVRFGAITPQRVAQELARRGIEPAQARAAARLADGSLGLAIQWLADGIVAAALDLEAMLDPMIAGRGAPAQLADWLRKTADAYVETRQKADPNLSADQTRREAVTLFLRLAAHRFQRVLRESADTAQIERACDAIEALAQAIDHIEANVNLAIALQHVSLTLARLYEKK